MMLPEPGDYAWVAGNIRVRYDMCQVSLTGQAGHFMVYKERLFGVAGKVKELSMFYGSYVALVTPFKDDLEIDYDAFGRIIDFQIENGTQGLVPCGCTGEAATLSHDEQKACIRFTVERAAGRVKVVAGTGSNNTREAMALTRFAAEVHCDGALLITPYYNKPTAAGQIAHYTAIAREVDIPLMLYNVPGRTGIKMEPKTIAALSELPQVVSIKEACGSVDQVTQILGLCDIVVLSGDDSLTLPMMAVGAAGVVSVAANIAPADVSQLCIRAAAGDYVGAREIHYKLAPLFKAMFLETNPMPVKAAMALMGLIKNKLRLPLVPLSHSHYTELNAALEESGITR
jgi:4-hydroxy-tetrahydrodipicolinate synthase